MSEIGSMPEPDAEALRDAVERLLDETVDGEEKLDMTVEDLQVDVPIRFGDDSPRARWRFNGDVTVTVDGIRQPLREWFDLHEEKPINPRNND